MLDNKVRVFASLVISCAAFFIQSPVFRHRRQIVRMLASTWVVLTILTMARAHASETIATVIGSEDANFGWSDDSGSGGTGIGLLGTAALDVTHTDDRLNTFHFTGNASDSFGGISSSIGVAATNEQGGDDAAIVNLDSSVSLDTYISGFGPASITHGYAFAVSVSGYIAQATAPIFLLKGVAIGAYQMSVYPLIA